MSVTIHINGHAVRVVDGTPTEGIGQLGPYAVWWADGGDFLQVADVGDFRPDAHGAILWECVQDRATRHTRWVALNRDEP